MAKIYFKVCIFLVLFFTVIGWLLPTLFSAYSDYAVWLGFAVVIVGGWFFITFALNIIRTIRKRFASTN